MNPGSRIPGIPADSLKMRVEYQRGPLEIGAGLIGASSQYAHGDENNADRNGRVPGYFVMHLDAQYAATPRVTLFAQVDNLFDRRYANFALLGANVFTGPEASFGPAAGIAAVNEQFRALGSPRSVWLGVRVILDAGANRAAG